MEKLYTITKFGAMLLLTIVHAVLHILGLASYRTSGAKRFLHAYICFGYHKRLGFRMIAETNKSLTHYLHFIWFSYKLEFRRN